MGLNFSNRQPKQNEENKTQNIFSTIDWLTREKKRKKE
jgi:hypothetical protein